MPRAKKAAQKSKTKPASKAVSKISKTSTDKRVDDRRSGTERRAFPRPEGRRASGGRRTGDDTDA